jgi:hypothetical protein
MFITTSPQLNALEGPHFAASADTRFLGTISACGCGPAPKLLFRDLVPKKCGRCVKKEGHSGADMSSTLTVARTARFLRGVAKRARIQALRRKKKRRFKPL